MNDPQSRSRDRHVLCVVPHCAAAMRKLHFTITQNNAHVVLRRDGVCTGGFGLRAKEGEVSGTLVLWPSTESPGVSASRRDKCL